jgi:hypothetical protein
VHLRCVAQSRHISCGPATGFKVKISERGYFPAIDDDELSLVLFRSQEIGCAALP